MQSQMRCRSRTKASVRSLTALLLTLSLLRPVPSVARTPTDTDDPQDFCLTPACVQVSADILRSIDTSVDPCESLYDFATSQWRRTHPIPAGKASIEPLGERAAENQKILRAVLEGSEVPAEGSDDAQLLNQLRAFYASCTDETTLQTLGAAPLMHTLSTIRALVRGRVPGAQAKNDDQASPEALASALAFMHSRGIPCLFEVVIDGDAGKAPNNMTAQFRQATFGLPSYEYYGEDAVVELYTATVARLLRAFHATEPTYGTLPDHLHLLTLNDARNAWILRPASSSPEDVDDAITNDAEFAILAASVVEFETKLVNVSLTYDVLYKDPIATYNPTPYRNLSDALPEIRLDDYIASMTPSPLPSRVIVADLTYAPHLSAILRTAELSVIEAYFIARASLALAPYLSHDTEPWLAVRALDEKLKGIQPGQRQDRAEWCVSKVEETMGFAAGRYFVKEAFTEESKAMALGIMKGIVATFKKTLERVGWMDRESAEAAARKADALRIKVGYPTSPDTMDPRSLLEYYRAVEMDKQDFFGNTLSAVANDVRQKWRKLGKQRNPGEWFWLAPSEVDAYYKASANEIVFTAGILKPPFFHQDWPAYLAFGSFGMVAGHELTHAFDSAGRFFNEQGMLKEWWTNATSKAFNERADCIRRQYANYTIDDGMGGVVHVNPNLTTSENIGDSGLAQSYRAWKLQYNASFDAGHEKLLPGLNYTREQLLFISFARTWGQNIRPAAAVARIRTDPHSPNRYRTDGTVANIPEFAEAFNCPVGSKLNPKPEDRCQLWT